MSQETKREVNKTLKRLLEFDVHLTQHLVSLTNRYIPFRSLKTHYKMLEISCHGVPWLACWLAFIWLINITDLRQMQINMFLGLVLDIIYIAIIKASTRRRRPKPNKDEILGTIGPDKFSFPSGHTSRAVFVTYFFTYLYPISFPFILPFYAWATAVSISRILMQRHHLLDILGGVVLGIAEGVILGWVWLGEDVCNYIYSEISDDKTDGGSYHV